MAGYDAASNRVDRAAMNAFDNRSEPRKKVCLQAFASGLTDPFDVKCIIRDVSKGGCMIVTSQIGELPELIQLAPEGFDRPLNGRIVWRSDKTGGVSFLPSDDKAAFEQIKSFMLDALADHGDEPLELKAFVRPLGYAERLAKFNGRARGADAKGM